MVTGPRPGSGKPSSRGAHNDACISTPPHHETTPEETWRERVLGALQVRSVVRVVVTTVARVMTAAKTAAARVRAVG